ncbi:MAG: hypothetical protein MAG453_01660 [Calditrichaeota bacterium]|nr:hypothetical protein [Calditrichota bacterium]
MFGDWEWYPMAEFLDGFFDGDLLIRANIGVFEDVGDYGLVEYKVYRDGEMIGTTDQEQFLETLPGTDVYEYTVESVYQQGAAMSDPIEVDGNNLGVEEIAGVPSEFSIGDAYPNPFNPSVTVPVTLGAASDVRMLVYDVLGREVATVHAGKLAAGGHTMSWTADGVASGVYFLRIDAGKVASTQKVVLMR